MSKLTKNLTASLFEGLNIFKYAEAVQGLWKKYTTILQHYFFLSVAGSVGVWVVFVNQRLLAVTQDNIWSYWGTFFAIVMSYLIAAIFQQLAAVRSRKPLNEYWGRALLCAAYFVCAVMIMALVGTFGAGLLMVGWDTTNILSLVAGTALAIASVVVLTSFVLPIIFGSFYFMTGEPFRDSLLRGGGMLWNHWTYLIGVSFYNYLLQIAIHFAIGFVVVLLKRAGLNLLPYLPSVEWHAVAISNLFLVGVLHLFFAKKKRYITAV